MWNLLQIIPLFFVVVYSIIAILNKLIFQKQGTVKEKLSAIFCPNIMTTESNYINNFLDHNGLSIDEDEIISLRNDPPPKYSPPPSYSSVTTRKVLKCAKKESSTVSINLTLFKT